MAGEDLLDNLIEKIAEAVVRKIEEREKIDLIAQAVIARLEEQGGKGTGQSPEDEAGNPTAVNQPTRVSRDKKNKTAPQRSDRRKERKRVR
jgi:hypothetical protein